MHSLKIKVVIIVKLYLFVCLKKTKLHQTINYV